MFKLSRVLVVYAIAVPLALVVGYLASMPSPFTLAMVCMLLFFFMLPLICKWHHALLIFFWNSVFVAGFLPGQPDLWLLAATFSFGISFVNHVMFQKRLLNVPEMTLPLFFLVAVVVGTALYRGGVGIHVLGGGSEGGKKYVYLLCAIVGYFALTFEQIPLPKGERMASMFFLSGATGALSNLIYVLGPAFYFFYYIVPTVLAYNQAANDSGLTSIDRITGFAESSTAALCFLLVRYGVRGLFDFTKPWRFMFLCLTVVASLFAGFRSALAMFILIFCCQFCLEGLLRTRFLPMAIGTISFIVVPVLLFAGHMPLSVQRTISFLPVNVDASVRADAKNSTDWRLQMWGVVWKDVPKYLIIGKGYSMDPTDMFLTTEAVRMGLIPDYEVAFLAGDYHSGPLSVLVPFGIPGTLAFLWVLGAGCWVLYSNYRHGDPKLQRLNSVLFSVYLANLLSFFILFGAFASQLFVFLGLVGFSISMNGGVKKKVPAFRGRAYALPETMALEPS